MPFHPEWEYGVVVMEGAVGIEGRLGGKPLQGQIARGTQ